MNAPIAPRAIWHTGVTLDAVRSLQLRTIAAHLDIVFTELGPDFMRATMPVDERSCQPMRLLHGGASVVLAETLASTAANSVIDASRCSFVGQEINANHLRGVAVGGRVTGTTRAFHIGLRSQVWGTEIHDERGRLVCISRMTLARVDSPLAIASP